MNRRNFTVAAAGAVATSSMFAASDTIETGMIGLGGRGSYLERLVLQVDGVRITHLCDINPSALDKAQTAAARDKPAGIADYRKLLEIPSINAVVIATPCYLHKEMIIAALEAGKNVYCEKPMAITPEDNRAIVEAAKRAKGILQIGFQRRYSERTREVIRRVHEGEIGKLLFARGQYYTTHDLPHHQLWKFKRDMFGDMIVEQAVHQFDMYNWIFQGPPVKACGLGSANLYVNDPPGRTIMDHYTISYEYPGGAHLNFSHLYYAIGDLAGVGDMFLGSKGAVVVNRNEIAFYDRAKNARTSTLPVGGDNQNASLNSVKSFFDCIRNNKQPVSNVEVGRFGALAAIMGRRAMVEQRVVDWKEVDV
jgi:myo-inositol 2-dehydrogenase/D-chiro-inositol 1-dehydrogenase